MAFAVRRCPRWGKYCRKFRGYIRTVDNFLADNRVHARPISSETDGTRRLVEKLWQWTEPSLAVPEPLDLTSVHSAPDFVRSIPLSLFQYSRPSGQSGQAISWSGISKIEHLGDDTIAACIQP